METAGGARQRELPWLRWADRIDSSVPDLMWRAPSARNQRRRNHIVDAIFVVFGLLASVASTESVVHGLQGFPVWLRVLDVAVAVPAFVAVFWRRRFPLTFAAYVLLVGIISTTLSGLAVVAVFTVAVHRRWPTALLTMLVATLAAAPYARIYDPGADITVLVLTLLATFAVTAWGMFIRARRELVATLNDRAEQAEAAREEEAERARLAERQRIAREMHDVLAHRLSLLSVHAGALEFRPDAPAEEIAAAAGVIRNSSHDALTELRSVVRLLREDDDQTAAPQPSLMDLQTLVDEARAGGTRVQVSTALAVQDVPTAVGRTVYRIVQEGLTNSRKHAPGSAVTVELAGGAAHGVTVCVDSPLSVNATGPIAPGSGTGLIGLRERAELAGGTLEHGVTADGHFRLSSWLPWTDPA